MSSLFRGMMPVSDAFQKDGETTEFASVILDFAEDEFMVIGAPIQTDHGIDDSDEDDDAIDPDDTEAVNESEPILIPEAGDEITIEITLPDGIRRFTSVVESEVVGPPGIRVEWPSSAERIQRRDYVRIDCFLETEVRFGELESEDERTIDACATDLSGGGARLTMTEAPEPETRIHLRI